ncbi:MAG: hypothetical protein ACLQT7_09215 [Candidatus Dormibacteria bacterium]
MKRIIGAAAAGVIAFSGIYALAASLSVTSNTLGAGTSVVASCTADTLTVTYGTLTYSSTVPGYTVSTVVIKDNTSPTPSWTTCNSLAYRVTLQGGSNASLEEATGTVSGVANTTGSSFTVTFASAESASLITGIAVVIGG